MMRRQITQLLSAQQRKRVQFGTTRRKLPIPKRISDLDFDEICGSFKISPKKNRDILRAMVDGATAGAAEFLTEQRSQPHRRDDRKLVASAIWPLRRYSDRWIDLGLKGRKPSANLRAFLVRWCPLDGCTSSFQTIASLQR